MNTSIAYTRHSNSAHTAYLADAERENEARTRFARVIHACIDQRKRVTLLVVFADGLLFSHDVRPGACLR